MLGAIISGSQVFLCIYMASSLDFESLLLIDFLCLLCYSGVGFVDLRSLFFNFEFLYTVFFFVFVVRLNGNGEGKTVFLIDNFVAQRKHKIL